MLLRGFLWHLNCSPLNNYSVCSWRCSFLHMPQQQLCLLGIIKTEKYFFPPAGTLTKRICNCCLPTTVVVPYFLLLSFGPRSICIPLSDRRVINYLCSSNSLYRILYLLCVTPHKLQRAPLHVALCPAVLPCRWVVAPLIIPITLCRRASEGSGDMEEISIR